MHVRPLSGWLRALTRRQYGGGVLYGGGAAVPHAGVAAAQDFAALATCLATSLWLLRGEQSASFPTRVPHI